MPRKPVYNKTMDTVSKRGETLVTGGDCEKHEKLKSQRNGSLPGEKTTRTRGRGKAISMRQQLRMFKAIVDQAAFGSVVFDLEGTIMYVNQCFARRRGYQVDELIGKHSSILHGDSTKIEQLQKQILQKGRVENAEIKDARKNSTTFPAIINARLLEDEEGNTRWIVVSGTDITDRKVMGDTLKEREEELRAKNRSLEETNTALKVLLERREKDRVHLGETVLNNMKELVNPFLRKIKDSGLDPTQRAYLKVLETNLEQIISPFTRNLSAKYAELTPTEIRVANLIRNGSHSKEIAELLGVSKSTIDFHRNRIREKLSLKNEKANLRSFLLSLQEY